VGAAAAAAGPAPAAEADGGAMEVEGGEEAGLARERERQEQVGAARGGRPSRAKAAPAAAPRAYAVALPRFPAFPLVLPPPASLCPTPRSLHATPPTQPARSPIPSPPFLMQIVKGLERELVDSMPGHHFGDPFIIRVHRGEKMGVLKERIRVRRECHSERTTGPRGASVK
jgi:hypothetical protein